MYNFNSFNEIKPPKDSPLMQLCKIMNISKIIMTVKEFHYTSSNTTRGRYALHASWFP